MTSPYADPEYVRLRPIVLARDVACRGYPEGIHGAEFVRTTQADHRTPLSAGGKSTLENLDGMCASCNARKGRDEKLGTWRGR